MSKSGTLTNPSQLEPFSADDKQLLRVVIETPKGSRNKFAFNEDDRVYELKKVLPSGMAFPYDFGFVPSTRAEDGDPLDVLVLMDEPAFPGCVLFARVIGVIEGEESDKKQRVRNDRVIAIERGAHAWADIRNIKDLDGQFINELKAFFVNYNKLSGKEFRVLGVEGPAKAMRLVKKSLRK
jgi:inorganic pyrophosphatase